ncbi:MAG: HD domain-containing protein [Magnetococcales bacterium]|nr:HD domain-containing protein [Magnetococcales bacterium]
MKAINISIILGIVIFIFEFSIMLILEEWRGLENTFRDAFIDATLLAMGLVPVIYWLVYRPQKYKNASLRKAHEYIESIFSQTTDIIAISASNADLDSQLQSILDKLLSLPFLSIESKGSIFLKTPGEDALDMIVESGLHPHLLSECKKVDYGHCLCGMAASEAKMQFSNCVDHRHTIGFEGMQPHGHYCFPITSGNREVLGVLNLYVRHGHKSNETEITFFKSICQVIAGLIERHQASLKLQEYNRKLEEKVEKRAKEIRRNYEIQSATNDILTIANENVPLSDKLDRIMSQIIGIPWLSLDSKGCIFTTDPNTKILKMEAHYGLDDEIEKCKEVPFGTCICGIAAETRELVFKADIDEDHHMVLGNMDPHGHYCSPLISNNEVLGVINLYVPSGHVSTSQEREFFISISHLIASAIRRHRAEEQLEAFNQQLEEIVHSTVHAFSHTAETRDPYTAGHQRRVSTFAEKIARKLNYTEAQIDSIKIAGILHDIGKITVPAEILSKPGKLSNAEFEIIKTHSQVGYEILRSIKFGTPIAQIVHQHHEKIDGSGYPLGLTDKEILPEAKILAVADVIEALASHRPYRASMGLDKALSILTEGKGTHFCPEAVEACFDVLKEHNTFEEVFGQDANHF